MISGIIRFEPSILAVDPGSRFELPVRLPVRLPMADVEGKRGLAPKTMPGGSDDMQNP